jgi:hypothetical protein
MDTFQHKEKLMSESGFERRLREESEQRRRRLREQVKVVPPDLTPAEITQLYDEMKEWHQRGKGEQGGALTFREIMDHFRELLNTAMKEPPADEDTPEGVLAALHGAPLLEGGRRRDRSGISNERFLEQLQGDDGVTIPNTNPRGGTY